MQLNSDTSKTELEDKVRSIVGYTWPKSPAGGPLGTETLQEYKTRLFDWLVNVTSGAVTEFQDLRTWCLLHAISPVEKNTKKNTKKNTQNLLQELKF